MFTTLLILDGGLATELERRGADLRHPLWSAKLLAENPEMIRQVHEDYFRAGADVATSASYQASFLGFAKQGLQPRQAAELMRLGVRLAQDARDQFMLDAPPGRRRPLVAASIGCYGACLHDGSEYRGDYDLDVDDLVDWHRPRLEPLLEAGPDLRACETIPCLREAEALTRLLEGYPEAKAWIAFCCRDDMALSSGEPFVEAVRMTSGSTNVVAVGVNCVAPRFATPLLHSARVATTKPFVVYPNNGDVWNAVTGTWENSATQFDWADGAREWRDLGAKLIGGCCRTTPETIRVLRYALTEGG